LIRDIKMAAHRVGDNEEQPQISQFLDDQQRSTFNDVIQGTLDTLQHLGQHGGDWAEYLSTSIQAAWASATANVAADPTAAYCWNTIYNWLRGFEVFYVQDAQDPDFPPALGQQVHVTPTVDALVDGIADQSPGSTDESYESPNDGVVSPWSPSSVSS
jgi:hypothetical protein